MAKLHIQIDLWLTPAVVRLGLLASLLSVAATELSSESVSLSTYYPAPSGVYNQMITTGNTFLARDAGANNVVIGGAAAARARLDLQSGDMMWGNQASLVSDQGGSLELGGNNGTAGTGNPYIDFHRTGASSDFNVRLINSANNTLSVVGNMDISANLNVVNRLGVNMASPEAALDVNGLIVTGRGTAGCIDKLIQYANPLGGTTNDVCAASPAPTCANCYPTMIDGLYSKKVGLGMSDSANLVVRCCPCPGGVCPSIP